MHRTHGAGGVDTKNNVPAKTQPHQGIDVRLMGMSRQRIDEEYNSTEVFETQERGDLNVAAQRAGGTGQAVLDMGVVLAPEGFAHPGEHRTNDILCGEKNRECNSIPTGTMA